MSYTVGEFASSLGDVAQTLSGIADQLKLCDQKVSIDTTPGRSPICTSPIIAGSACAYSIRDPFIVADLLETVEGLRDWVRDVESKLSMYNSETAIDGGTWAVTDDVESA